MQVNSSEYWDHRFQSDWAESGGPHQTRFFAKLMVSLLPEWLVTDVRRRGFHILDYGCAEGDAVPILADALPGSIVGGADVARAGIEIARERYPGFRFAVLDPAGACRPEQADVVVCSNVLEHFAGWRSMLETIGEIAREHIVVLVPFREPEPLADEHMVVFDSDMLPPRLAAGHFLTHVAVVETTSLPELRWGGHQLLGVWSRSPPAAEGEPVLDLERLDLRGLGETEIAACLRLAKRGLSVLSQERETAQLLRTQLRQLQDDAAVRITELNNQLIRTTTELKNDLVQKTTELNNELIRTTTELNNEIWRINVNSANELAHARTSLANAKNRLSSLQEAVSAHNARLAELTAGLRAKGISVELEPCELGDRE